MPRLNLDKQTSNFWHVNKTNCHLSVHYLTKPATVRKPIKSAKPAQTPGRPIARGAYNKNVDDIAPTNIYMSQYKCQTRTQSNLTTKKVLISEFEFTKVRVTIEQAAYLKSETP